MITPFIPYPFWPPGGYNDSYYSTKEEPKDGKESIKCWKCGYINFRRKDYQNLPIDEISNFCTKCGVRL